MLIIDENEIILPKNKTIYTQNEIERLKMKQMTWSPFKFCPVDFLTSQYDWKILDGT